METVEPIYQYPAIAEWDGGGGLLILITDNSNWNPARFYFRAGLPGRGDIRVPDRGYPEFVIEESPLRLAYHWTGEVSS